MNVPENINKTATAQSIGRDLGAHFHGSVVTQKLPIKCFDFGSAFQTKVAAMSLRDVLFNERTSGLIKPEYFENHAEGVLVNISLEYFNRYRRLADFKTLIQIIKEKSQKKLIREDIKVQLGGCLRKFAKENIADREFVVEKIVEFARHRAMESAILRAATLLESNKEGKFGDIEKAVKGALQVGANEAVEYDLFDAIEQRTEQRKEELAGNLSPRGVSTGVPELDKLLYHKGWGRGELSVYMGGAKAGKTTALINAGLSACMSNHNVLYITCEVSKEIVAARADANLTDMTMDHVRKKPFDVRDAIKRLVDGKSIGQFKVHEFPSGQMRPADLKRLIEHYKAQSVEFDLVVIDYLDIMMPNYRTNDSIENSKSVWIDVRAIAQEEDVAILSATQTNREGFKSSVAKAEHVAEDFNKIRTADIVISINKTDDEAARGEARLYFAASRNQAGGYSLHIKQDLEKMKFIVGVLSVS